MELYLLLGLILSIVLYRETMKKVLFVIVLWPAVLLKGLKKSISKGIGEEL